MVNTYFTALSMMTILFLSVKMSLNPHVPKYIKLSLGIHVTCCVINLYFFHINMKNIIQSDLIIHAIYEYITYFVSVCQLLTLLS